MVTRAPTLGWTPGSLPRCHLEVSDPPVTSPLRSTDALISAAFARVADAHYAMGILETCGDGPVRATLEPILDDRGEVQLVMLHIEIDGIARDRVLAAISGGHGVAMTRPDEGRTDDGVARIA